ncbi:MAG: hypothetical protein ACOY0S_00995 [Patescibacteria group bacterium]
MSSNVSKETIPTPVPDPTQEAADIGRLVEAGTRTNDPLTTAAGVQRAAKLARETGLDLTNPTTAKLLKLDKLPPANED